MATLFAEAIINRTPWQLWALPNRRPAEGAGTLEAMEVLERGLTPDAGHLLHMPSHIDILCGHYFNAVVANNQAIKADNKYLKWG